MSNLSPSAFAAIHAVNYSRVAAVAFLLYDILITQNQEISLIWPKPWTLVKCAYFWIRYVPVSMQISFLFIGSIPFRQTSHHTCYIWQLYEGLAFIVIIIPVDYILILRVYALYYNKNAVKVIVGLLYFLEVLGMVLGLGLSVPKITYNEFCSIASVPKAPFILITAASVVFQAVLFGLTVAKFVVAIRDGWRHTPLMTLMMRDGTWAFSLIFAVLVASIFLFTLEGLEVTSPWMFCIPSFAAYRILFNLQSSSRTTTVISFYSTSLHFGSPPVAVEPESYELRNIGI